MVAVEMWEPAFGAGFQARWDGQQIFGQDAARGPTERHFHSEPGILPILMRILSLAAAQDQNVRFQKPTQNEHCYRLSCRADFRNLEDRQERDTDVLRAFSEACREDLRV